MNRQQWMSENKKRARMWDTGGSLYAFLQETKCYAVRLFALLCFTFCPFSTHPIHPSIPGIRICQVTDGDNRF